MDVTNAAKHVLAKVLIAGVHYPWRGLEKLRRRNLPVVEHYLIMKMFRLLAPSFPVTIAYPNPLRPDRSLRLTLDLCENNQQWYFRHRQYYEIDTMRLIGRALGGGGSFIDVGANIGVYALAVAQAFPHLDVVAVEPLPANFAKLCENIRLNGLISLRALCAAVADREGEVTFFVNPIHDGGGSIVPDPEYRTGDVRIDVEGYRRTHPEFAPEIAVRATRLDELVQGPCVVKIDVEGAEVEVLRSGLRALRQGWPVLLIVEVRHDTSGAVRTLLHQAGYRCFALGPDRTWQPLPAEHPARQENLAALREDVAVHEAVTA